MDGGQHVHRNTLLVVLLLRETVDLLGAVGSIVTHLKETEQDPTDDDSQPCAVDGGQHLRLATVLVVLLQRETIGTFDLRRAIGSIVRAA